KNAVVVTPTASGKTLCYNLPILNAVLENPDTRALYLFPTKALAQDQLAELQDLAKRLDDTFGVFTYDGDTPSDARKAIRERGHKSRKRYSWPEVADDCLRKQPIAHRNRSDLPAAGEPSKARSAGSDSWLPRRLSARRTARD